MRRILPLVLVIAAFVALAVAGPTAQGGAAQKPPDPKAAPPATPAAQKPADTPQELPEEAKAFNAAMAEKNPLKRVELLEKFIADNPKATASLVSMAKSQVSASLLAALKESRTKYQVVIDTDIENAKKNVDLMPMYATYNSIASRLSSAGIYSDEAEDFARKGLAGMDERTYTEMRKKQYERALASYERMTAASKDGKPAAPAPAPSAGPNYSFASRGGVMQATIAPPRPAPTTSTPPRQPNKPSMPTDEEMKSGLKSERGAALATLGQILMKRGKQDEGVKALKEALDAGPAAAARANIARTLYESAKASGNDGAQLEYLTMLVLSGRPTADELKAFDATYRKTHNGSADGMEAMLDERWRRDNAFFEVTPFARPAGAKSNGRTVLAEVFPGAG